MKLYIFFILYFSLSAAWFTYARTDQKSTKAFIKAYTNLLEEMEIKEVKRFTKFHGYQNPQFISPSDMETNSKIALQEILKTNEKLKTLQKFYDLYLDALRYIDYYLPSLAHLENLQRFDLRGYLYFQEHSLNLDFNQQISRESLLQMCLVTKKSRIKCLSDLNQIATLDHYKKLYDKYYAINQSTFTNFFELSKDLVANNISWRGNTLILPIRAMKDKKLEKKIKDIIEPYYKSETWHLEISFQENFKLNEIQFTDHDIPHVIYERAYATLYLPHFFDLDQLKSQKILAHEFGHFLGLKDCYIEFYDPQKDHFVYYELDSENLMCHLNGKITNESLEKIEHFFKNILF